jgi:hypothetical protein
MKKTYHLCLSAGEEVMFRDLEDYNRGFNCLALALFKTDSNGLVESFMSTHTHQLSQTSDPAGLMYHFRLAYCMYFNRKYHRHGKLGEDSHFTMEVVGYNHMLAAASYVLRNALHHGVAPLPYAYPHCSANAIFMKEMGKTPCDKILDKRHYRQHIGKTSECPANYKMSESGVFLRETVLDIPQVENLFVTPRAFNWYMTRKSSEEWDAEQQKDKNGLPSINILSIEEGVKTDDTEKLLIYENGKANYRRPSDIDICKEIDRNILPQYGKPSIYTLSRQEKQSIAEYLYRALHISEEQIRRCLALY